MTNKPLQLVSHRAYFTILLILDILSWVNISLGHDLHLEEAEVPTDSEFKVEAYDSDDSDI